MQSLKGFSLFQLKHLHNASKVSFLASIGEIFLPITWRHLPESEAEKMFIGRRIYGRPGDDNLADDLISTGCQLCGTMLSSEIGWGEGSDSILCFYIHILCNVPKRFPIRPCCRSDFKKNNFPLCQKSSNGLHVINMIYRPFQVLAARTCICT